MAQPQAQRLPLALLSGGAFDPANLLHCAALGWYAAANIPFRTGSFGPGYELSLAISEIRHSETGKYHVFSVTAIPSRGAWLEGPTEDMMEVLITDHDTAGNSVGCWRPPNSVGNTGVTATELIHLAFGSVGRFRTFSALQTIQDRPTPAQQMSGETPTLANGAFANQPRGLPGLIALACALSIDWYDSYGEFETVQDAVDWLRQQHAQIPLPLAAWVRPTDLFEAI